MWFLLWPKSTRKDICLVSKELRYFYLCKLLVTCFITQYIIDFAKCFMCTCKKCVYCHYWFRFIPICHWGLFVNDAVQLFYNLNKFFSAYFISYWKKYVKKSPTMIIYLSISLTLSIFCFLYFEAILLVVKDLYCEIFLMA